MVVLDFGQDLVPAFGVQTGGRLVQHEDAGLHGHDARHRHAALLAAGQFKGAALQQGLVQADKAGGLVDAAVDLGLVQPMFLGPKAMSL